MRKKNVLVTIWLLLIASAIAFLFWRDYQLKTDNSISKKRNFLNQLLVPAAVEAKK